MSVEALLVGAFPMPDSAQIVKAYSDLWLANPDNTPADEAGKLRQTEILKENLAPMLPRPWDPSTCVSPALRRDVWQWLERVACWINFNYVWDVKPAGFIPPCWPMHPHIVHELAVLADQRRNAQLSLNSNSMEEWHRYCLPTFFERAKLRIKEYCEERHQVTPSRDGRYQRHLSEPALNRRGEAFTGDLEQSAEDWRSILALRQHLGKMQAQNKQPMHSLTVIHGEQP
jgi:hypothetical protein